MHTFNSTDSIPELADEKSQNMISSEEFPRVMELFQFTPFSVDANKLL